MEIYDENQIEAIITFTFNGGVVEVEVLFLILITEMLTDLV